MVHGDLKPRNVLRTGESDWVLCDLDATVHVGQPVGVKKKKFIVERNHAWLVALTFLPTSRLATLRLLCRHPLILTETYDGLQTAGKLGHDSAGNGRITSASITLAGTVLPQPTPTKSSRRRAKIISPCCFASKTLKPSLVPPNVLANASIRVTRTTGLNARYRFGAGLLDSLTMAMVVAGGDCVAHGVMKHHWCADL